MGRHSTPKPNRRTRKIEKLDPASESAETPEEQQRRRNRQGYTQRQRRRERRKRVAYGCMTSFAVVFVAFAVLILFYISGVNSRLSAALKEGVDETVVELLEQAAPEESEDPFYMLIMGVDNREGETRARSDTLIVARIDPTEKTASLISIPRDTRVVIPGYGTNKINAANALGGPALVIETVKDLTGLPISKYLEVDFQGFKDLVNALGGVSIDVPSTIIDPQAGDYDPSAYKVYAGQQTLNGAQALTFVRSRNFPDGDLTRIKNQQLFLRSLLDESLKVENALRAPQIIESVVGNVTTNFTVRELLELANSMNGMGNGSLETATMPGSPQYVGGVSYVIMDEDAFAAMIQRVKTGDPLDAVADDEDVLPMPFQVTVDIRNGAGIAGVAGDCTRRLKRAGFVVGEPGNMNQFVYDETLIVYENDPGSADVVQQSLGIGKVVSSRGMYSFTTDVLVVVGKDWGPAQGPNTLQHLRE